MQVAATSSLESVDSRNQVDDLSGTNSTAYANPYDALIEACGNDPVCSLVSILQFLRDLSLIAAST